MEWQPIETAPKDMTEVLACHWRGKSQWSYGPYTMAIKDGAWVYSNNGDIVYEENSCGDTYPMEVTPPPTHWMPLPALPVTHG